VVSIHLVGRIQVMKMRGLMTVTGTAAVGGALGLLAGALMPGVETALLGAAAGLAAGILACITQSPSFNASRPPR
jgi:hypothetical protein